MLKRCLEHRSPHGSITEAWNFYAIKQTFTVKDKTVLSLHFCLLKGSSDPFLPWPFSCPISFTIVSLKQIAAEHSPKGNKEATKDTDVKGNKEAEVKENKEADVKRNKEKDAKENKEDFTDVPKHYSKHFDPRVQSLNSPCLQRPLEDKNKSIGVWVLPAFAEVTKNYYFIYFTSH